MRPQVKLNFSYATPQAQSQNEKISVDNGYQPFFNSSVYQNISFSSAPHSV